MPASGGIGYGPGSDQRYSSKRTGPFSWSPPTTVIGIPSGEPSQMPPPKLLCRYARAPIPPTIFFESRVTGSLSTGRFHWLSRGKTGQSAAWGSGAALADGLSTQAHAAAAARRRRRIVSIIGSGLDVISGDPDARTGRIPHIARKVLISVLLAASLVVVACGGDDRPGPDATVRSYYRALLAGDG